MSIIISGHSDKNNFFGANAMGMSLETLTRTYCWFDCTGQWRGSSGAVTGASSWGVGLFPSVTPSAGGVFPSTTSAPIWIEWTAGTNAGTIKETYKSFGTTITTRDNVDPGYGTPAIKEGPRYTLELSGTEYRVYINKQSLGTAPIMRIAAPGGGFPFPLRLVGATGANLGVMNIAAAGDLLPTTILSSAEQVESFGSNQTRLFLRIRQKSRYGIADGVPLDIVVPSYLHDNLVAMWRLEEASGTRYDSKGTNNLTDINTVTQVAGKIGYAAKFTMANSEYLSIADNATVSTGDVNFALAGWCKFDSNGTSGYHPIVAKQAAVGALEFNIQRYTDFKLKFSVFDNSGANTLVSSLGTAANGVWHFFAVWHDKDANTLNIRLNNEAVQSLSYSAGVKDTTAELRLGHDQYNNLYLDGALDSIGFWKRVFVTRDLDELWNGGRGVDYPF